MNLKKIPFQLFCLSFWVGMLPMLATAQFSADRYAPIEDRLIVETKWKYTYTLHVESNTIIHKAEDYYQFYLYFRYDNSYQEFLNDKFKEGNWSMNNRTLLYTFNNVSQFKIEDINRDVMVLQFNQPQSKGTYQYHFVKVTSKEAPFLKPTNELPEVLVYSLGKNGDNQGWLTFNKKKKNKTTREWFWQRRRREKEATQKMDEYFNVELIGGGYYGGIDPVLKDFIQIKGDGRLIKEFQSLNNGLRITKKDIPIAELEQLALWIESQGFFEMERIYDCQSLVCMERKQQKPSPIPLRLSVSYGTKKKVITIPIYGVDDKRHQYITYPSQLDNIIDAVQKMANRLEAPVTGR